MIKGEITYRSLLNYVLGVYSSVWAVIAFVLVYNRFQVLSYDSVSGKTVLFSAFLMPSLVLYILMKRQNEVRTPKEFLSGLFAPQKHLREAAITAAFCLTFFLASVLCGEYRRGSMPAALFSIFPIVILEGFQEMGFRGFLAEALGREIPFGISAVLTGTIWGCLYFPLWFVKGAPWASFDFLLFLLNCVFQSILLNSLYLLTGSVFACMVFRSFWAFLFLLFDGLMFDNGVYTIYSSAEMILVFVAMAVLQRKKSAEKS